MILVRSGSLFEEPLPQLVYGMYRERLTGILSLISSDVNAEVYVRQGYPTGVTVGDQCEQLGQVLLEAGLIDQATYRKVIDTCIADGALFGQSLVAAGTVTMPQLQEALRLQIRRRLHRLFSIENGEFAIQSGEHWVGIEGQLLRTQPRRAIYQGLRAGWLPDRVRAALAPLAGKAIRLVADDTVLSRFGFTATDAKIVGALRERPVTIEHVIGASGQSPDAVRAVVCTLFFTETLELTVSAGQPGMATGPRRTPQPQEEEAFPPEQLTAMAPSPLVGSGPVTPTPSATPSPTTSPGAAMRPERPADSDVAAMRAILAAKTKLIDRGDLFEVLGLPRDADGAAVKAAYLFATKVLHPDRFAGSAYDGLRNDATRICSRLNEAYSMLRDDTRRAAYLSELNTPTENTGDHAKVQAILDGEAALVAGEDRFRRRDFPGAVEAFTRAVQLHPEAGEPRALLAWARVCAGQATLPQVRSELRKAVEQSPECARAHLYYGKLMKEEGFLDEAYIELRKALRLDRGLTEAWSELRVVAMRRQKRKGIFDRLLRK
ncbi:MAG: hypothetical protein EXR72_12300 [Myxococcales bacterium]|nr:hypothetical protein [Myxococcales bacterium]